MATLAQIAYDIMFNLDGTSRLSDDTDTEIEQIYYKIDTVRAQLIRQDQAKGRSLSSNIIQIIPCLKVIEVSSSECCNVDLECTVLRSETRLPKPIELYQKDLIVRVAGADVTGPHWNFIPVAKLMWAGKSQWTKDSTKWTFRDGYIYIINAPTLSRISVSAVFENPRELAAFQTCEDLPCYSTNDEYPISGYMLPIVKQMVIEDMVRQKQTPQDFKGDTDSKIQNKLNG